MVTSKRSTVIIGGAPAGPTRTSVNVSDGDGNMDALADPPTVTGWPRILVASCSKLVL